MSKEFYAVTTEESYFVPGDERSRTNPGHGYPEETVSYTGFRKFDSEKEMKDWVTCEERHTYSKKKYQILKCVPLEVKTSISIEVT